MHVERTLEFGILIGGPLVEDEDGPRLQVRRDEGEAFALALRELGRAEAPVLDPDLVIELQVDQQLVCRLVDRVRRGSPELLEDMAIREDDREELSIGLTLVLRGDGLPVHDNLPFTRSVETDEELRERRLAAAIPSDDEDDLAGSDPHVDRTDGEARRLPLRRISKADPLQLQLREGGLVGSR